jgi:hypothetical protein
MAGWVYLAYRDQTLIGAGERLEDAQHLCATDAARRGERTPDWRPAQKAPQWDNAVRPRTVLHGGIYGVKRVAVAGYADGDGG